MDVSLWLSTIFRAGFSPDSIWGTPSFIIMRFPGKALSYHEQFITRPPETRHNLQFSAGVGFRF